MVETLQKMTLSEEEGRNMLKVSPTKKDESRSQKAVEWFGKKDMRIKNIPFPLITDPEDIIVRVTSTCICGSDLHIYLNAMPGMKQGDVMGHEFMGVVEDVGPEVKGLKKGDRVVSSFAMGCGRCFFCKKGLFTGCDSTNPSGLVKPLYGDRPAGFHGYTHLTGGWDGGQAEFSRIPFAEESVVYGSSSFDHVGGWVAANTNALKVPDDLSDEQVVLLSDILPTAWHANELAEVGEGDNVAIWGAGPVGILAAHCAFARGASRVVLIDQVDFRLKFAKKKLPKVETINFGNEKVYDKLREMFVQGPDVGIEAVGFHYCKSWTHSIQMALMLETDPSEILNEIFVSVRKGGRIGVVGVYSGLTNGLNIGAFMEKGLSMRAGQTPVQKYWHSLLNLIQKGKLDPAMVITHELPLEDAAFGYKIFNDKEDNCIKVLLKPKLKEAQAGPGAIPVS
eukprot:jgi/Botrbrau1/18335/Bobra.0179s0062.1